MSKALTKTSVISASLGAKNSTVFPIPVRLWNFFSVLRRLGALELELQAIRAQGDKFGVRRFPLDVAHGVAKEVLRGVAGIAGKATASCDYGVITPDCRSGQPDPTSEAFLQMAEVFSQLELSMIRMRVRSGMANARAKGIGLEGRRLRKIMSQQSFSGTIRHIKAAISILASFPVYAASVVQPSISIFLF